MTSDEPCREPASDNDIRRRTDSLLAAAERVSMQLVLQTERLAAAIEEFDEEVIRPMRKVLE